MGNNTKYSREIKQMLNYKAVVNVEGKHPSWYMHDHLFKQKAHF